MITHSTHPGVKRTAISFVQNLKQVVGDVSNLHSTFFKLGNSPCSTLSAMQVKILSSFALQEDGSQKSILVRLGQDRLMSICEFALGILSSRNEQR